MAYRVACAAREDDFRPVLIPAAGPADVFPSAAGGDRDHLLHHGVCGSLQQPVLRRPRGAPERIAAYVVRSFRAASRA